MAVGALADSGPLVAVGGRRDRDHLFSIEFFKDFDRTLHTTWPVVTEVCHLLPREPELRFLRSIWRGGIEVHDVPKAALGQIAEMMEKYSDLPMDFADATLVWLADEIGVRDIATFDDRDFAVYRTAGGKRFNNLLVSRHR